MVLLMLTASLAGCTSGDPDGDGGIGIDTDTLNQMIEDNLQDFINNTTVTVNQEIHYHNNTSHIDNSESNMNIGNGNTGGNGSTGSSIIQVIRIHEEFNPALTDVGAIQLIEDGVLQFPAIGFAPTMTYLTNGTSISMSFTCEEFYNARNFLDSNDWENWARYELGLSWSNADRLGEDIYYDLQDFWDEAEEYCRINNGGYDSNYGNLFSMQLQEGEAISFTQLTNRHHSSFRWNLTCVDGYTESGSWYSIDNGQFIGGWADCEFVGLYYWTTSTGWSEISLNYDYDEGSYIYPDYVPEWYHYSERSRWTDWIGGNGSSSFDGIFYFTKYFVVPAE